ncbi:MAG: hypothetical protein WCX81_00910 [Monoglobales bacterium]
MKKLFTLALVLVMVFSLSATAFAKTDVADSFVAKANSAVEAYVQTVTIDDISDKDYAKAEKTVEKANEKILKMVEKEMDAKKLDLDKLVEKTNDEAFKAIEKCAKMGIEVICEYKVFEIQGNIVYIDPLRVVRR